MWYVRGGLDILNELEGRRGLDFSRLIFGHGRQGFTCFLDVGQNAENVVQFQRAWLTIRISQGFNK